MWCLCISGVTSASATTIWETHYCVCKWDMGALKVLTFYSIIQFHFFSAPALQLCSHWPDAVHVGGFFFIDLSGFDTLSYVINWGETITVICKRLMKHCLIPADLTWFAQHCSLLLPLFLLLFQQSRMELPSSSSASLYSPLFWSSLARHFSL